MNLWLNNRYNNKIVKFRYVDLEKNHRTTNLQSLIVYDREKAKDTHDHDKFTLWDTDGKPNYYEIQCECEKAYIYSNNNKTYQS